ncbi:UDP-N-acetylmuramoyl-L-alanine--D-glutamate ligase [Flocculibacter collagenilyticus]|uniref:UDP-N-acetylmuramoyl-L-alanine--D-glutamate ligase n=1 Tax=Flocculibacter collagenilyticus TaxID=2744479 RepID=UPI0018F2E7F6|nr:UDP-N-acetylmuramoyl-L-alanine--D-glutamate ligase [Flocculibacter collagenilyticus]
MSYLTGLQQQHISILGAGISGLAAARYLKAHDCHVTVYDDRAHQPNLEALQKLGVTVCYQEFDACLLQQSDLIVVSPGIALSHPALSEVRARGIDVIGDVELFARINSKPVIAITGSNGKSTVTQLVGELLNQSGISACVAGNIGLAVLGGLFQDSHENYDVFVLELSSFQLETLESLRPLSATVLNISEDHMDRYNSYKDYIQAKHHIYRNAALCVYNSDDQYTYPEVKTAACIDFSVKSNRSAFFFNHATQEICFDSKLYGGDSNLISPTGAQHFNTLSMRDIGITGLHNISNIMAALALISPFNIDFATLKPLINQFKGLPHRCELIGTQDGIAWINDSKATNVGATVAAIEGVAPLCKGKVILIAGGDSKAADLSPLSAIVAQYVSTVFVYGKDADLLMQVIPNAEPVKSLNDAVTSAQQLASEGDVVLLSPACASLDMYKNFEARGEHFVQLVNDLSTNKSSSGGSI